MVTMSGHEDQGRPNPRDGNHGGRTYTLSSEALGVGASDHEGQTSALRARVGGVMLDYLRAVLPDDPETWAGLDAWLGTRSPRVHGWRGWYDRSASVLDGGIVGWCTDPARASVEGVLVDLPGRACAALGDKLVEFMAWCLTRGRVTRADYAVDDVRGRLSPQKMVEAYDAGQVVTRWQGCTEIKSRGAPGETTGHTCYLGSRSGQSMLRVYDKRLEQLAKGHKVPDGPWVRCELETRGKFADRLAREVLEHGAGVVVGQLNRRVRVVDKGTDMNKRRWAVAPWWEEFIGCLDQGAALTVGEVIEYTVERIAAWIERVAAPSIATVLTALGGDMAWIAGVADRGRHRMGARHKMALAAVGVT